MPSLAERWQAGIDHIQQRRRDYTDEQRAYNNEIADKALAFFQFGAGPLLDVGCGTGWMRHKLPQCEYTGVDPVAIHDPDFHFQHGMAERLPFAPFAFQNVLCFSVLQHVIEPAAVLAEITRVLLPQGTAGLLLAVNDPNPVFLHQWTTNQALAVVCASALRIISTDVLHTRHLIIRAVR